MNCSSPHEHTETETELKCLPDSYKTMFILFGNRHYSSYIVNCYEFVKIKTDIIRIEFNSASHEINFVKIYFCMQTMIIIHSD